MDIGRKWSNGSVADEWFMRMTNDRYRNREMHVRATADALEDDRTSFILNIGVRSLQ